MPFLLALALALPIAAALPAHPAPVKPKAALDQLFVALAKAPSAEYAEPIEREIGKIFEHADSPSIDLLMTRSAAAISGGDKQTARQIIDSITNIDPDFAEAWHRRAMLQQDDGDDAGAMISLQKVVSLNPRHFEAYSELGDMLESYGDKKAALSAYRKALALDPQMDGAAKHVEQLTRTVEGEKI
ncbi:MAG TPA: tetratricopeptide repeat protein [Rhizomicrobium sp.]|jgi:tetratricopeptide (TPR) repeat protein